MEQTSKRVAKIAGKVLARLSECKGLRVYAEKNWVHPAEDGAELFDIGSLADLKALAASALTQAPDRKKAK